MKAYVRGTIAALEKLGLADPETKRIQYAGIQRTQSMKGEAATGNYDELLGLMQSARSEAAFAAVDRNVKFDLDNGNRTDFGPSAPVVEGGL